MSGRLYRTLLCLYPSSYRERYGAQMLQLFGDGLRDARAGRGESVARVWIRGLLDLVTNAIGEHLRGDRTVAHSIATFRPTAFMRVLGLIGVVGAVLFLAAFVTIEPFLGREVSTIRIAWFAFAGAAISLGFYQRLALVMSRLAFAATVAVAVGGVTYAVLMIQSAIVGYAHFGIAPDSVLWVSAALYGAVLLRIGAATLGMTSFASTATRLGAILLVGAAVAWLAGEAYYLASDGAVAEVVVAIEIVGFLMNGLGWLLLGTVLLLGGRRRVPA